VRSSAASATASSASSAACAEKGKVFQNKTFTFCGANGDAKGGKHNDTYENKAYNSFHFTISTFVLKKNTDVTRVTLPTQKLIFDYIP
jgi:hypothetical protein